MRTPDEQIGDVEKLHVWRQRARTLQKKAVEILSKRKYEAAPGWRAPGDDIEKALMLHAVRGESEQVRTRVDLTRLIKELTSITPEELECPTENVALNSDRVPVFRAASIMQALVEMPRYALSKASLSCFYRIVREFYEVVSPSWTAGAARAEEEAGASAFVTGECARALLALEGALCRTADAAVLLGKAAARQSNEPENAKEWSEQASSFRSESLRVSLEILRPNIIVELPTDGKVDPSSRLKQLVRAFKLDPEITVKDLEYSPAGDEPKDDLLKASKEASRKIACNAVSRLLAALQKVAGLENKVTNDPDTAGKEIASELRAAAQELHRLLAPVDRFASSVIDRELAAASPHLGREVDAAELVFAATVFGHLSGWEHPKVKAALELVRTLLSPDGRLLSLRPFDIGIKGYRLHVATLEVTRRLAELVANVNVEPEPQFVDRLMRPFTDTRAFSPDGSEPGWATDPPGPERESEWWVTALAADALEGVVRMLDAAINRQVLQHFSVRRPSELDPKLDLDGIFYPDFGLCAKNVNPESVAITLQRLRAHTSNGPLEKNPLFSLILYGPPGTGKTTLVEALARSADVPLVEITPSDILIGGAEQTERRTRLVFSALSMLTHVVILFDEFDSILQDRELSNSSASAVARPRTVFEFLTPGLLPKLKKLHDAAKEKRVSYVLATNFVYRLDKAATRSGRFDAKCGLYPPDVISRVGRLLEEFQHWAKKQNKIFGDAEKRRLLKVVKETADAPMGKVGKPGWYTAPENDAPTRTLFAYISQDKETMPNAEAEATFDKTWRKREKKNRKIERDEKKYWTDWEKMRNWDAAAKRFNEELAFDWDQLVERWTE
jgi:ATPase family associated with various cellular activities (AAA)